MTFDQSVLWWCAAVPALIALAAAAPAWLIERGERAGGWTSAAGGLVAGAGWWLAVAAVLAAQHSWQWWPEDAWRQAVWPVLAAALLLGGTTPAATANASWRWIVAGLLAVATAWVAMPSGEGWSDMFELHRTWMVAVTASCLLNGWALDRMARRGAQRWVLWVALAGLGGPMALAAGAYSALAEWTLSAIAATAVFAVVNSFAAKASLASTAFPAVAFLAAMTASARFYSYEEISGWVYAAILFLPALIAAVDTPLHRQPPWRRILAAAILAALAVGVFAWLLLSPAE